VSAFSLAAVLAPALSSFFIGAPATLKAAPLTVRPSPENFAALPSPMPFTRVMTSSQSLNGPPFLRSSMIFVEIIGPMPLIDSRSAWVALLTSTAANAAAANSARMTVSSFLIMMVSSLWESGIQSWQTDRRVIGLQVFQRGRRRRR